MITPITMHDEICNFLQKEVAERYNLRAVERGGNETFRNPQIIRSGWILPKSIDEGNAQEEEFPFIIPRIERIENVKGTQESIVTLQTYIGIYDPGTYNADGVLINDGSGYRDFWNIVESIRQAFWEHLIIAKKCRLMEDFFDAQMIEEQIYPYWEGWLKTKWFVIFPHPNMEDKFF